MESGNGTNTKEGQKRKAIIGVAITVAIGLPLFAVLVVTGVIDLSTKTLENNETLTVDVDDEIASGPTHQYKVSMRINDEIQELGLFDGRVSIAVALPSGGNVVAEYQQDDPLETYTIQKTVGLELSENKIIDVASFATNYKGSFEVDLGAIYKDKISDTARIEIASWDDHFSSEKDIDSAEFLVHFSIVPIDIPTL